MLMKKGDLLGVSVNLWMVKKMIIFYNLISQREK